MLQRHFDGLCSIVKNHGTLVRTFGRLGEGQLDEDMYNAPFHHVEQARGKRSGACRASARGRRESRARAILVFLKVLIVPRHGNQYGIECTEIYKLHIYKLHFPGRGVGE